MIPKPVRKIIYLMVLLVVGYWAYDTVRLHTSQEVIAFKQYSEALLDYDGYAARKLVANEDALRPFKINTKRKEELRGDIRFVWYSIKSVKRSKDNRTANISVKQIIKIDPPGFKSFLGTEERINNISVTMVCPKSQWQVQNYSDSYYHQGMKE